VSRWVVVLEVEGANRKDAEQVAAGLADAAEGTVVMVAKASNLRAEEVLGDPQVPSEPERRSAVHPSSGADTTGSTFADGAEAAAGVYGEGAPSDPGGPDGSWGRLGEALIDLEDATAAARKTAEGWLADRARTQRP